MVKFVCRYIFPFLTQCFAAILSATEMTKIGHNNPFLLQCIPPYNKVLLVLLEKATQHNIHLHLNVLSTIKLLHVLTYCILFVTFSSQYFCGFVLAILLMPTFDPENMRMMGHALRIGLIGIFLGNRG